MQGVRLHLPSVRRARPDPERLEERWEEFRQAGSERNPCLTVDGRGVSVCHYRLPSVSKLSARSKRGLRTFARAPPAVL